MLSNRVYWEDGWWYFEIVKQVKGAEGERLLAILFRRQCLCMQEAIRSGREALRVTIEKQRTAREALEEVEAR